MKELTIKKRAMNSYKRIRSLAMCLVISLFIFSCGKMDENYRGFLENGEFIYPGKADSFKVHSGDYRVQLSWIIQADPRVVKAKVYWNSRADSIEVPIQKSSQSDTIKVILENLEEKMYTFEVFTYNDAGDVSIRAEAQGQVYGDLYRNALLNRAIRSVFVKKGVLGINWLSGEESAIGGDVFYTNNAGQQIKVFVPALQDSTWLPGFVPGNNFKYNTRFLPDSSSIDTFYSAVIEREVDPEIFIKREKELSKANFAAFNLPTDTYEPNAAGATMDKIWDGVLNKESPTFITKTTTTLPQWFTFDLGVEVELTKMKINQRGISKARVYNGGNVKKWEIWGSTNPNPDGSWDDSWVLLAECESVKPSGPGEVTDEDLAYALAGEEFTFNQAQPVRYIRFKTLENWDTANRGFVNIGQLTFWGVEE